MAIYSGETVNDAIEKGLKDLKIDKRHTKISIIQEPKPGILGKFSKEAKVEIIILTDAELETKKKLIKFGIIAGIAVFLIILLGIIINNTFTPTTSSDNREIAASGVSSDSAIQEKTELSSSEEDKTSKSTSEITNKLKYTVTKKENQNIITGDVSMTGGDGTKVNVEISADNIKPGTYVATWTPDFFKGTDPGSGFGLIWINGDPNTIQIMPEESVIVTFNEGDIITFQFAGRGQNDRIKLIQE